MSRFIYQQIALDVFFQMRYNSLPKSNKQQKDSLRYEATPAFSSLQYCSFFCFASCFWPSCSGVCKDGFKWHWNSGETTPS